MKKMFQTIAICAAVTAFSSQPTLAQSGPDVLFPNQDTVFDQSGKLRVDQAVIYKEASDYVLEFRASSMDANCDFSGSNAAWLNLQVVADGGRPLGPMRQIVIASVTAKGGHHAHRVTLNDKISSGLMSRATAFNMSMPGRAKC
ncbi:MAG: hypothetical protein QNJ13_16810 [Paracoccaceae bacterium]|nr:hypothetical protein [Paracoccaceae bacterium]